MPGKASTVAPLSAILVAFALWAAWGWSPHDFGYLHDDSLYMSAGRSIAQGEGYRFPSLPVDVSRAKYPVGYPLRSSLVWTIEPDFPDVLGWAFALHILIGWCFLSAAYVLFRQLEWGKRGALALTAVCAFHPGLMDVTRSALSDLPFMALALGSAIAVERALRNGESHVWTSKWWALATALAVAAVMTRSIGVAVIAGIFLVAAWRRALRPALVYAAIGAIVFVAAWASKGAVLSTDGGYPGFAQTLLFYTDYVGFWRFAVPDWTTFGEQLEFNGMQLLKAPAYLCFFLPLLGFSAGGMLQASGIALSVGIVRGAFRGARSVTIHPVAGAFILYLPIVLLWNFSLAGRFLLLFVPFLYHGAAQEIGSLLQPAREAFRKSGERSQRVAAVILCTLIVGLIGYAAHRCLWRIPQGSRAFAWERAALNEEKESAYQWIRENTDAGDHLVAYEDVVLYFRTGRQALRPIAPSTASFYLQDLEVLQPDIDRLGDTARATHARYWLVSEDDYHLEHADTYLREATAELLLEAPVVFESPGGLVKLHDLIEAP